ncbi:MAG: polysaccharide biosynthesis/export family protein [Terriglobales bacterium]|jgi:polysaccharide biosynthesis/export protein
MSTGLIMPVSVLNRSLRGSRGILPLILFIAFTIFISSAQTGSGPSAPQSSSAPGGNIAKLGPDDLVEVSVYNVPELTSRARVNSSGNIYLPLIGYVQVGGLTLDQAQTLVEKHLSDGGFVKDPHVSILVAQPGAQGASVLGQVNRPGVYPVSAGARLFDLVSAAGGLTDKAGRSVTVTRRDQPDKPVVVDLARNLEDTPENNIAILPGDTIVIRKADIVYVVGDVGRPSGFLMESGRLTVLQAIALAGGTTHTAKLSGARLIHKGPDGLSETSVHLQKILSAKSPDIPMQADDILFVPSSTAKVLASRTAEAAMQAATAVSIIAVQ